MLFGKGMLVLLVFSKQLTYSLTDFLMHYITHACTHTHTHTPLLVGYRRGKTYSSLRIKKSKKNKSNSISDQNTLWR